MLFAIFSLLAITSKRVAANSERNDSSSNSNSDSNSNIDNDSNTKAIHNDLISWVRSRGGSFSDKIEIRRVDPTDLTSYMGVFVREPIEAKESLFAIPRDCYIDVFDTAAEMDQNDENVEAAYHENLCSLATKLMKEMKLGKESEYAPYLAYLDTQKPGQLPANWSKEGKDLLRRVAIPGSPIVDWIDWYFKGEKRDCIGNKSHGESKISFEEHMVEMTVQRCFDTALIPIWDMVNHDNGKINTENDSMHEADGLRVRAARSLEPGEEVFASYDKCLDCQGLEEYWGTPEILKDFGFVENYPHRWVFSDQEIWIQVYEDYEFDAYFGDDETKITPGERQLEFLTKELARLEDVEESFLVNKGNIPNREWETISRFHSVAVDDLTSVVEWYTYLRDHSEL